MMLSGLWNKYLGERENQFVHLLSVYASVLCVRMWDYKSAFILVQVFFYAYHCIINCLPFLFSSYVASGDQTPILRTGYWASYNTPFYEYVYNVSGYPELVKKYGPEYSYQLAPRAKIFRRDESNVCAIYDQGLCTHYCIYF